MLLRIGIVLFLLILPNFAQSQEHNPKITSADFSLSFFITNDKMSNKTEPLEIFLLSAIQHLQPFRPSLHWQIFRSEVEGKPGFAINLSTKTERLLASLHAADNELAYWILAQIYAHGWCVEADVELSIQCLEKSAQAGSARALWRLGWYYIEGQGVPKDVAKGFDYLRKAGEKGSPEACQNVAYAYATGEYGVLRDQKVSLEWYQKAADLGVAEAMNYLGSHYYYGREVEKNPVLAFQLYSKAARLGYAEAQNNLGYCYANGIGVERDESEATKSFSKAAKAGNLSGMKMLAEAYRYGRGIAPNPAKYFELMKKIADKDDAEGYYGLSHSYIHGIGTKADLEKGMSYLHKAIERNHDRAMFVLAEYLEAGYGIEKDEAKALEWFTKSAELGCTQAMLKLASRLEQDILKGEAELKQIIGLYEKAAAAGSTPAMLKLGELLLDPDSPCRDSARAVGMLTRAFEAGEPQAFFKLGFHYENGVGLEKNREAAIDYYLQAADKGSEAAGMALRLKGIEPKVAEKAVEIEKDLVIDINTLTEQSKKSTERKVASGSFTPSKPTDALKQIGISPEFDSSDPDAKLFPSAKQDKGTGKP